jgi:Lipase (class 3)
LGLNTTVLASLELWAHLRPLALYLGLGLLLLILVTYLRVRNSPAYNQKPDEIVERAPGARLLSAPEKALPEAKIDLDFALLSQAAYDKTPHGLNNPKQNVRSAETDLAARGWSLWPPLGENSGLPQKLESAHLRVQVWVNASRNAVAVTFGGTVVGNGKDWKSNLRWFIPFHEDEYTETVQLFNPAFADEFARMRRKMREPESVTLYSTGHSLGGGLAQQFAYSLPVRPDVPRVSKVYAFDPSPVTGYFSVKSETRRANRTGLRIDRIYERGEILAYVRSITNFVHTPSAKNPEIRHIRYNLFQAVNPFKGHSISELAALLWDLIYPSTAAAPAAVWRRPTMW